MPSGFDIRRIFIQKKHLAVKKTFTISLETDIVIHNVTRVWMLHNIEDIIMNPFKISIFEIFLKQEHNNYSLSQECFVIIIV